MRKTTCALSSIALAAALVIGCAGGSSDIPPDEALARARKKGGEYERLGKDASPDTWKKAAYEYYPPAERDYFEDMDAIGTTDAAGAKKLALSPEAVKGRNAWVLWAAGNEAWWDWLARYGYGSIDLLKLIDSDGRDSRFARTGLINEPGTRPPTEEETAQAHGVRYARPITPETLKPGETVHVEYRKDRAGWHPADPYVYGYPTGVVGLRLFPNPEFTKDAEARWNKNLYYDDVEGRKYAARPDTIRPFRVGMSCGFCHIAPHPLNPPADPERPEWANLSNNIGNQYMRIRAVFGNTLRPDNYLYHVFDAQQPGAVDTSGYPSDNNNNPNTINSFFGLPGRVVRAQQTPKETISADSLAYLDKYVQPPGAPFANPHHVPRVLLDGSDSVGVHIALSRVYLNIGTHHQQWIRVTNPLLGFRKQEPFKLRDIAENSLYWHATLIRIDPLAAFFTASTDPMRLKDAPLTPEVRAKHLRGNGLPWHTGAAVAPPPAPAKKEPEKKDPAKQESEKLPTDYAKGRAVFAKGCIACHSSVQPGDLPELEAKITAADLPAPAARTALRLREEDRWRLTRGDGTLPPAYARWAREAVNQREFWETKSADGKVVHNFLSIDERLPITMIRTNSGRAAATNSLHGHVWEDFASQTYKELDSVGRVGYRDPFSGADKSYAMPAGGPGYYRVPTLISVWATAPFLHNNALGKFNNDPSVKGRLDAFDDAIDRLLTPAKRREPATQVVWDIDTPNSRTVYDGWYDGKREQKGNLVDAGAAARSTAQRDADGGWIWRTSAESWLRFDGPHVPNLVGGLLGLSYSQMKILPWLPSIVFVVLGVLLLLSGRLIAARQRLERAVPVLDWLFAPLRWVIAVGAILLAVVTGYLIWWKYWYLLELLDVSTAGSMPWLEIQASAVPLLFLAVGVLFLLHRIGWMSFRLWLARWSGAVCLFLAVALAFGFGRFLSGHGGDVVFGPIPEGVPVNVIANMNPEPPGDSGGIARTALIQWALDYHRAEAGKKPGRKEFEERVAPALLNASKCPDFVTDRGHDYEFIRRLSDEEKRELIALLKTF